MMSLWRALIIVGEGIDCICYGNSQLTVPDGKIVQENIKNNVFNIVLHVF